jgi:hypothetical protein
MSLRIEFENPEEYHDFETLGQFTEWAQDENLFNEDRLGYACILGDKSVKQGDVYIDEAILKTIYACGLKGDALQFTSLGAMLRNLETQKNSG